MASELRTLVELSRTLGEPGRDLVILAEGNTSIRTGPDRMLVKASGSQLGTAVATDFVEVDISTMIDLVNDETAPVYSASKHAVHALAHGIRRQLIGTGVRIGSVAPGVVLNDLWKVTDAAAVAGWRIISARMTHPSISADSPMSRARHDPHRGGPGPTYHGSGARIPGQIGHHVHRVRDKSFRPVINVTHDAHVAVVRPERRVQPVLALTPWWSPRCKPAREGCQEAAGRCPSRRRGCRGRVA